MIRLLCKAFYYKKIIKITLTDNNYTDIIILYTEKTTKETHTMKHEVSGRAAIEFDNIVIEGSEDMTQQEIENAVLAKLNARVVMLDVKGGRTGDDGVATVIGLDFCNVWEG